MPQTKMFRDRLVSMEQTLEGGEKNLELLKALCREALPEFEYREYSLDHERDLFVMTLEAPDGRRKNVGWTRMVLFDAERIPSLNVALSSPLRLNLLSFIRARANRPEIVVTFRHLEDGWVDASPPRKEKRRGRRGRSQARQARPLEKPVLRMTPTAGVPARAPERRSTPGGAASPGEVQRPSGSRRRRFRRRRRGRAGHSPTGAPPTS